MIKKIFAFLGLDKKQDISLETDRNSISFIVTKTDPFIKIVITDTSETDVINLAQMLYELHNGLYLNSIMNLLLDMSKKDQSIALFNKRVLQEWARLQRNQLAKPDLNNDNNEPVVRPTHFYRLSKNE